MMEKDNSFAKQRPKKREGNMKDFIIICSILIIIFLGAIYTNNFLKKTTQDLLGQLKNLKEDVKNGNKNLEELKKQVDDIYNNWDEIEEKWAFVVLHNELDLIETSFVKMKAQIEENALDRSLEEIETNIFLVDHIYQKEKFNLKNIF